MHKNATKCNETLSKWCKNKHGVSKIMDTFETYQEAKMEDIKPLLAHIQVLKSGSGGVLSGTQLMAFFLQRRV
jgi:hypothetical protein